MKVIMILAYVDPGAAGIVIQMIIAGAVGVGVYFRRTIGGLWLLLTGKRSSDEAADESKYE